MASKEVEEIFKRLEERPWYEKLWLYIWFINFGCRAVAWSAFKNKPINQKAIDVTVNWIKDDIEFGYTTEMIYDKIKLGQYDNTPEKPKE